MFDTLPDDIIIKILCFLENKILFGDNILDIFLIKNIIISKRTIYTIIKQSSEETLAYYITKNNIQDNQLYHFFIYAIKLHQIQKAFVILKQMSIEYVIEQKQKIIIRLLIILSKLHNIKCINQCLKIINNLQNLNKPYVYPPLYIIKNFLKNKYRNYIFSFLFSNAIKDMFLYTYLEDSVDIKYFIFTSNNINMLSFFIEHGYQITQEDYITCFAISNIEMIKYIVFISNQEDLTINYFLT